MEYDTIRRIMPPGNRRTQSMTRILVQMRGLSLAASKNIRAYTSSGSAGSRMVAIAIVQMDPKLADLDWLVDRFDRDEPFIFYHAALALQNFANESDDLRLAQVQIAAKAAKRKVESFNGTPDASSIEVLESISD